MNTMFATSSNDAVPCSFGEATVILGMVVRRMSPVTVPTWTTILEERLGVWAVSFVIRKRERWAWLFLERRGLPRFGVSLDLLDFLNSKYLVEVGICAMHKETV